MTREEAEILLYRYQLLYARRLSFNKSGSFTDYEMKIFHEIEDKQEQILGAMAKGK